MLFANQAGENQNAFSKENLKGLAEQLGLDTEQFNECVESGQFTDAVLSQSAAAQQLGVRSTPSFLVNGQAIVGAEPFETFQQVIESSLSSQ